MMVAIKRWYRTFNLLSQMPSVDGDVTKVEFKYVSADKAQEDEAAPERYGQLVFMSDIDAISSQLGDVLNKYEPSGESAGRVNSLHIALAAGFEGGSVNEDALVATVDCHAHVSSWAVEWAL